MKFIKKIFEDEESLREDQELAEDYNIRGFKIDGMESTSDGYKLHGYKSGELGYVLIKLTNSGDISISYQDDENEEDYLDSLGRIK